MTERGKYIVIEGHDGTGKSTQVEMLGDYLFSEHDIESEEAQEPAGVPFSDKLREIIKNGDLKRSEKTDLLLFTAARREIHIQKIIPALGRGAWMIAARNWISTVAYQGYGEGLDPAYIKRVTEEYTSPEYMNPDLTVVLDLKDDSERNRRISERGELENPDTFESRGDDFQSKVKQGYLEVAKENGFTIIDAGQPPRTVHQQIVQSLSKLIEP